MGNCYNSIVVDQPVEKVWDAVKDFHNASWATGVVENLEVVGEAKGNQLGAKRILNGAFHEELIGLNDRERLVQYTITEGPGPLAKGEYGSYVGTLRLFSITASGQTFVEWGSKYEGGNDSAIGELCNPVYQALLGALKKGLES